MHVFAVNLEYHKVGGMGIGGWWYCRLGIFRTTVGQIDSLEFYVKG